MFHPRGFAAELCSIQVSRWGKSARFLYKIAKALSVFAKANPALTLRVGVIDGQVLEPPALRAVADLPSREALRGQLVGAIQGPLAALVGLLNAPLRELAYVLAERGKAAAEDSAGSGSLSTDGRQA